MVLTFGKDTSESSLVFGNGVGSDQEVVHIDVKPPFIEFFLEYLVHHCLERGRGIAKTKEHNEGFKASAIRDEGCFPFIAFLDPNIVISPADVEFGEDSRVLDLVYEFRDQGEGITVLHGQGIEFPVILDRSEVTRLLFDEEEGGRDWRFRRAETTGFQIFFKEIVELLLLHD